jgi:hypothetical protein
MKSVETITLYLVFLAIPWEAIGLYFGDLFDIPVNILSQDLGEGCLCYFKTREEAEKFAEKFRSRPAVIEIQAVKHGIDEIEKQLIDNPWKN